MIAANNVTLQIGKKALFEDVNIKFTEGKLLRTDRSQRRRKIYFSEDSVRAAGELPREM